MKKTKKRTKSEAFDLIASILSNKYSVAYVERALNLSCGTLKKWANGNHRPVDIALLKVISAFPWLIDVAAEGYKEEIAKKYVVAKGVEAFLKK